MLTIDEINVLGGIINTTWGKFSTDRGSFPLGSAPAGSLTAHLASTVGPALDLPKDVIKAKRNQGSKSPGDAECVLVINYVDIVNFRSNLEVQANVKLFREVAEKRCAAKVAEMKGEFKSSVGRTLKVKLKEFHDSVEAIYTTTPTVSLIAKPTVVPDLYRGYYRYTGIYRIS